MLIKKPADIKSSEITDKKLYLNRRMFMRGAVLAGTTAATALLYRQLNPPPAVVEKGARIADVIPAVPAEAAKNGFSVSDKLTSFEDITNYNNFYEFSTEKRSVAAEAR